MNIIAPAANANPIGKILAAKLTATAPVYQKNSMYSEKEEAKKKVSSSFYYSMINCFS